MINRYVPKLIISGFVIITFVMMSYVLATSSVFDEEANNYIVELQDKLLMESSITTALEAHVVIEDVLIMEDSINVLIMEDKIDG